MQVCIIKSPSSKCINPPSVASAQYYKSCFGSNSKCCIINISSRWNEIYWRSKVNCYITSSGSNNCNSPAGDTEAILQHCIVEATFERLKDETAIAFPFTLNEVSVGDLEKSKPKNIVVDAVAVTPLLADILFIAAALASWSSIVAPTKTSLILIWSVIERVSAIPLVWPHH